MSTPHVLYTVSGLLAAAAVAVIVWVVVSLTRDYRAERGADREALAAAAEATAAAEKAERTAERLCRGEVDADIAAIALSDATQPLDIVDHPRQIHGRTVPELMTERAMAAAEAAAVNQQFAELIAANYPDQT